MKIKDIFVLLSVNNDTLIKCYDTKGSLAKPIYEGHIKDLNFMSEHGHDLLVGIGDYNEKDNTLEVFIYI